MAQSLAKLTVHLTFSTKQRRPFITPEIRPDLNAYIGGILNTLESSAIEINCVADHAHVLFNLSRTQSLADVVEHVKKSSSKWAKTRSTDLSDFRWQAGYGAFSASRSNVPAVQKYILNQDQHHHKMTFQEEFLALLTKHGIEFDEQYVWD